MGQATPTGKNRFSKVRSWAASYQNEDERSISEELSIDPLSNNEKDADNLDTIDNCHQPKEFEDQEDCLTETTENPGIGTEISEVYQIDSKKFEKIMVPYRIRTSESSSDHDL